MRGEGAVSGPGVAGLGAGSSLLLAWQGPGGRSAFEVPSAVGARFSGVFGNASLIFEPLWPQ